MSAASCGDWTQGTVRTASNAFVSELGGCGSEQVARMERRVAELELLVWEEGGLLRRALSVVATVES